MGNAKSNIESNYKPLPANGTTEFQVRTKRNLYLLAKNDYETASSSDKDSRNVELLKKRMMDAWDVFKKTQDMYRARTI